MIDLDPSLPGAEPNAPFVKMQEVVPGNQLTQRLRNERHTVQLRIMIERWEDGKLVKTARVKHRSSFQRRSSASELRFTMHPLPETGRRT